MNQLLPLTLSDGATHFIAGGSFFMAPPEAFTIKLAPEIDKPAHLALHIADFGVPRSQDAFLQALDSALHCMQKDTPVYVGCFAGIGRTGMFLCALAKCVGVPDPLAYVRTLYHPKAVETPEQFAFVQSLPTQDLQAQFANPKNAQWRNFHQPQSIAGRLSQVPPSWTPLLPAQQDLFASKSDQKSQQSHKDTTWTPVQHRRL